MFWVSLLDVFPPRPFFLQYQPLISFLPIVAHWNLILGYYFFNSNVIYLYYIFSGTRNRCANGSRHTSTPSFSATILVENNINAFLKFLEYQKIPVESLYVNPDTLYYKSYNLLKNLWKSKVVHIMYYLPTCRMFKGCPSEACTSGGAPPFEELNVQLSFQFLEHHPVFCVGPVHPIIILGTGMSLPECLSYVYILSLMW